MSEQLLSDTETQLYYFGLYRALKRYRLAILLGWAIVVLGVSSIVIGCRLAGLQSLLELALSVCTTAAGLGLVQLGISSLGEYVRLLMQSAADAKRGEGGVMEEIIRLMEDIDQGGWQEALSALKKLEGMATTHGLPPLP